MTAKSLADFILHHIIKNQDCPRIILTDQGAQMRSSLVKCLTKDLNIKQVFTSAYHPQTDGLVERFNRTLQNMLSHYVNEDHNDWDKWIPYCQIAYNSAIHFSSEFSPFYLMYDRECTLPIDTLLGSEEEEDDQIIV